MGRVNKGKKEESKEDGGNSQSLELPGTVPQGSPQSFVSPAKDNAQLWRVILTLSKWTEDHFHGLISLFLN